MINIRDGGIGKTAEQARLAVRPFDRVDDRLARDYDGLGLGRSIVSRLIERHDGRIGYGQCAIIIPTAPNWQYGCRGRFFDGVAGSQRANGGVVFGPERDGTSRTRGFQ